MLSIFHSLFMVNAPWPVSHSDESYLGDVTEGSDCINSIFSVIRSFLKNNSIV